MTLERLRMALDPWLGIPKREFNNGLAKLVYRVRSESEPSIPIKLKVEINTREHFSIKGWVKHPYTVNSRWFNKKTEITTYTLDELLGTKLRALYQRKKGRDLFDLWISLKDYGASPTEILECFAYYMKYGGFSVTSSVFQENLEAKMKDKRFTRDISPLLRPDIRWNLQEAMELVKHELLFLKGQKFYKLTLLLNMVNLVVQNNTLYQIRRYCNE